MASIMAIISKGVFETLVKEYNGAALGSCIPLDKYLSANKALTSLADGGSLFLVTVRPPNESLWLVAILESPEFKTDHWESSKNAIPITDITNLMSKLTFENGNGITAKPGLLGASLQSPRRLVDSDIKLLRDAAGSKGLKTETEKKANALTKEDTVLKIEKTGTKKGSSAKSESQNTTVSLHKSKNDVQKEPSTATNTVSTEVTVEHALSSPLNCKSLDDTTHQRILKENQQLKTMLDTLNAKKQHLTPDMLNKVSEIVANAATSTSKVVKEMKALAKKTGDTTEIAAAWDIAAAAILSDAKKSKSAAGDCHGFARIIERALGTEEKDINIRLTRDAVFASQGAIWMKELISTLKACTKSTLPDLADIVVDMSVNTVASAGELPKTVLLTALRVYGNECPSRFLALCIKKDKGKGLFEVESSFWNDVKQDLAKALKTDDDLVRWVATYIPRNAFTGWVEILIEANIAERFSHVDPELALPCLELIAGIADDARLEDSCRELHIEKICELLTTLAPIVKAVGACPIDRVITWQDIKEKSWVDARSEAITSRFAHLVNFEILDLLLSFGLDFKHSTGIQIVWIQTFFLWISGGKRETAKLQHVANHPIFSLLLEISLARNVENGALEKLLTEATKRKGMKKALAFLDGLAELMPHSNDQEKNFYIQKRNDALVKCPSFQIKQLLKDGNVGGLEQLFEELSDLTVPSVAPLMPNLCSMLLSLDPVKLYNGQLRAGLLDEFGDVRQEKLLSKISKEGDEPNVFYDYPNLIIFNGKRLVVEGLDGIIIDKSSPSIKSTIESALRRDWSAQCFLFEGDVLIECGGSIEIVLGKHKKIDGRMDNVQRDLLNGGFIRMDGKRITSLKDINNTYYPHDNTIHSFFYDSEYTYVSEGNHFRETTLNKSQHYTHCIGSGERLKKPLLPSFFQRYLTNENVLFLGESKYKWVSKDSAQSPMPSKDGLLAFACYYSNVDNCYFGETITGLKARSTEEFEGIVRFPYRSSNYICYRYRIEMENSIALIPEDQVNSYRYWATKCDGNGKFFDWNEFLIPRDLDGSKALSQSSEQQSATIYKAAEKVLSEGKGAPSTGGEDGRFNEMMLTVNAEDAYVDPHTLWPTVTDAVKQAYPSITDKKLIAGVARMAVTAVEVGMRLDQLKLRVAEVPTQQSGPSLDTKSYMADELVFPLDPLFEAGFNLPGRGRVQFERQITEVSEFLFPITPDESNVDRNTFIAKEPSQCHPQWERCLIYGGEFLFQLLAPGTSYEMYHSLLEFFTFFRNTAIASNPDLVGLVGLKFSKPPVQSISSDHKDFLVKQGGRRLFLRCQRYDGPWIFSCLHVEGRDFQVPPGAEKIWEASFTRPLTAANIEVARKLMEDNGPFTFSSEAAHHLSKITGILYGTAAMVLSGSAYRKVDNDLHYNLNASVDDIAYGKEELGWSEEEYRLAKIELHNVISKALPDNLQDLFSSQITFADSLGKAWVEEFGTCTPLDIEIVRKLEDDLRDPYPDFVTQARALAAPEVSKQLNCDIAWAHRPWHSGFTGSELYFQSIPNGWPLPVTMPFGGWPKWPDTSNIFSYSAVYNNMKLIAWANLELETGNPLREKASKTASLIETRFSAQNMLFPVGTGPITDKEAFWNFIKTLNSTPYCAPEGESADGIVAGGLVIVWPKEEQNRNGVFISLATGQLTESNSKQILLQLIIDQQTSKFQIPGADIKPYPYWHSWRLWNSDKFQSLIAELSQTDISAGAFVANPAVSAPESLKMVQQKHNLSIEASMLYLQVAALGEPSAKRVMRYNNWKKTTYEKAVKELIEKQLIVDKKYKTAKHTLFLPGNVVYFDRYPAPVETAKLSLLELVEKQCPPLGVPLNVQAMHVAFECMAEKL